MSAAEAQARHLAALAAQAFSGEQMRLVGDADIVGDTDTDPSTATARLAELPPEEVARLVQMLATNPHLLGARAWSTSPATSATSSAVSRNCPSQPSDCGPPVNAE